MSTLDEAYDKLSIEQQEMWQRAATVCRTPGYSPLEVDLAIDVTCMLVTMGYLREHLIGLVGMAGFGRDMEAS